MDAIDTLLQQRKKYLLKLKKDAEKQLKKSPDGTLRISNSHGRTQYYHRCIVKEKCGTYIPRNKKELAAELAQKDYYEKLLYSILGEMQAIEAYINKRPVHVAEEVFDGLSKARQDLVIPLIETDDLFAKRWQEMPYQSKGVDSEDMIFVTDKGEKVRSKSELIIANQLAKAGVPYHYECPLDLKGYGVVYPDFTVLNIKTRKVLYWEHQGMMDDAEYVEKAIRKTALYQKNGIYPGEGLILTSESRNCPLDTEQVVGMIRHFL